MSQEQDHGSEPKHSPSGKLPAVPLEPVVGPRDWPDDFPDENGKYMHKCFQCDSEFIGHKHRLICRACDDANKRKWDAMTNEEREAASKRFAEAVADVFGRSNPAGQAVPHETAGKE